MLKSYGVFINALPEDYLKFNDVRYGLAPWIVILNMPDYMKKPDIIEVLCLVGAGIRKELFDDQTYHSLQLLDLETELPENWDGCWPKFSLKVSESSLRSSAHYRYGEYCKKINYGA